MNANVNNPNARYEYMTRAGTYPNDVSVESDDPEVRAEGWQRAWVDVDTSGVFIVYRRPMMASHRHPFYRFIDSVIDAIRAYDRSRDHTRHDVTEDDCVRCRIYAALPGFAQDKLQRQP